MKLLTLIFVLCTNLAIGQSSDTVRVVMFSKCVDVSIKPVVYEKIDTTFSYVKQIVLQRWPYSYQMPDSSEYDWGKVNCKQIIEVEIQEPYWKEPKQYTFKDFKKLIYGK